MLVGSHIVFSDRSNYILTFLINGNTAEGRTLCGYFDVSRSTTETFYKVFYTKSDAKAFIKEYEPGLLWYQMWKKHI